MPVEPGAAHTSKERFSTGYVRYALWLLLLIFTLNFMDRQIVAILAEPIKTELRLSDAQIGLLGGLAFAFFFTVLGIPIARYAEHGNRVRIISVAVIVWSGFTAVCGVAQNFAQLLLARIGVGIGEAGCTPPAHSLIADYVPAERRASALAFYSTGIPIGAALGYVLGASIATHFGWRAAFLAVGVPGVLVGVIAWLTLKEPRTARRGVTGGVLPETPVASGSFASALGALLSRPSYGYAVAGAAAISFLGYGQTYFLPSFLTRVHDMGLSERGIVLAAMTFVSGVAGTLIGGRIADRYGMRDPRAYMVIPGIAIGAGIPVFLLAMIAETAWAAVALIGVQTLLNCLWYGPVYAAIQGMVLPGHRATAVAVMLFVINMFGLGLGPFLVGFASDWFAAAHFDAVSGGFTMADQCVRSAAGAPDLCAVAQAEGLRQALMATNIIGAFGLIAFFLGARTIALDMRSARDDDAHDAV